MQTTLNNKRHYLITKKDQIEFQSWVEAYIDSDKKNKELEDKIFKILIHLSLSIANKYNIPNTYFDDCIACIHQSIHRSFKYYDIKKGGKFFNFFWQIAQWDLITYLNKIQLYNKRHIAVPFDTSSLPNQEEEVDGLNAIVNKLYAKKTDIYDYFDKKENRLNNIIKKVLNHRYKKSKNIYFECYILKDTGYTYTEIFKKLHLKTPRSADNMIQRVRRILKAEALKDGSDLNDHLKEFCCRYKI